MDVAQGGGVDLHARASVRAAVLEVQQVDHQQERASPFHNKVPAD
jgi:hypothetical protein